MSHEVEYVQWSDNMSTKFEIAKNDNKMIRFLWPDHTDYDFNLCIPYFDVWDRTYKFKWDLYGLELEIPLSKVRVAKMDLKDDLK